MSLVTFGETMLRYTPPEDGRIEAADSLSVHVGGAESNVAVAAQRLGRQTAWISKLPDSPLADRIVGTVREHGVEPLVTTADEGRVGTYYLETGGEPRGTNVVYDRDGAAVRTATPEELPVDRVRAADTFYTSGITPALSETLTDTVADLAAAASEADTEVAFDLNYRAKLWSPETARRTLRGLLPTVDTLVVAARDVETVLGRSGDAETVARDLAAEYDPETVVVTRGARGALAIHDGDIHEQPAFEADSPYPVGTGDAFVGGFLARRGRGGSVPEALEYAAAVAALKRTIPGDVATVTPAEVADVIAGDAGTISR